MFNKVALLLCLYFGISSTCLLASNHKTIHSSISVKEDCPTIDHQLLQTANTSNIYTYLFCPYYLNTHINQFRFRAVGTSLWRYTSLKKGYYRFVLGLLPGTEYEYQFSYICENEVWSDFSKSALFKTTGQAPDDKEEEMDTSEETDTSMVMTIDSTHIDTSTIVTIDSIHTDTSTIVTIDSTNIEEKLVPTILIQDAYASCGESTLCTDVIAENFKELGSIQFAINWDTTLLRIASVLPNADLVDTIDMYQMDSTLSKSGSLFYSWTSADSNSTLLQNTTSLFSVCFTSLKDSIGRLSFSDSLPVLAQRKRTSTTMETLSNVHLQVGEVVKYSCDSIHLGGGSCAPIDGSGLSTNTVEETSAYIHTHQPNGVINNQFRYRINGAINWKYTDVTDSHFRRLTDLQPGTYYEFQVSHICEDNSYSDYSVSYTFRTKGESTNGNGAIDLEEIDFTISEDCMPVDTAELLVSTIKQYFTYIYAPQPYGPIRNQFRYRVVGSPVWLYTNIASTYYRYLMNLQDGQLYEYQVSHECSAGAWSAFSGSFYWQTLPSINFQEPVDSRTAARLNTNDLIANKKALNIYPNLVHQQFTYELSQNLSGSALLNIVDLNGRSVQSIPIIKGTRTGNVEIANLKAGMYYVRIQAGKEIYTGKFVKLTY